MNARLVSRLVPGLALFVAVAIALPVMAETPAPPAGPQAPNPMADHIAPYVPRFGRRRPVIAFVAENSGTELADFFIPYGVLGRSGAARLISVGIRPGPVRMLPALTLQPDTTIAGFDAQFPEGADYVIVPAVSKSDDPALVAWVAEQGARGATIISICDGAFVVANSGLMTGRRATAHWASEGFRRKAHPEVAWVTNVRYVVDGKVVSSAGISAGLPTALALVEAIAGHDAAESEARELGISEWGTAHDSTVFKPRLGHNLLPLIAVNFTNSWFRTRDRVGIPVADGVDEGALGFTADAWSRTGLSRAYAVSATAAPVRTRYGLTLLPEAAGPFDQTLPPMEETAIVALDRALAGIEKRYGRSNAYGVALDLEYPGFRK